MKIDCDAFRIHEGEKVHLGRRPTQVRDLYESHPHYEEAIGEQIAELTVQQRLLYANSSHSLLLIFQAMDAAGKDSAIAHVMSGVNPQGCQVHSFKHPSAEELSHDFLWRSMASLPARGQIGIFNRSYYEEVLIVRVYRLALFAWIRPTLVAGTARDARALSRASGTAMASRVRRFVDLSARPRTAAKGQPRSVIEH